MEMQAEDTMSVSSSIAESYVKPLLVRFNPPAFVQRRAFVLNIIREMNPKCESLLDVGTGEGGLLSYLKRCDDVLPLRRLVGIDPDPEELEAAIQNVKPTSYDKEEDRWRPLSISLFRGGVADIAGVASEYDCITAIEVLEHLDPPDVEALSEVCLGKLQPRRWIVTTPNRDFNHVFERIDEGQGHTHFRTGIDYAMRHDDHRFEMTRREFEDWARTLALRYGYEVEFSGVGTVQNAFAGQSGWQVVFPERDLEATFGYSTQSAVFTRVDIRDVAVLPPRTRMTEDVTKYHVSTCHYPWSELDDYPPKPEITEAVVLKAESSFRPAYDAEKDYADEQIQEVIIDCKDGFFHNCYAMQRASRFDFEVFLKSVKPLLNKVLQPPRTDVVVVDDASCDSYQFAEDIDPKATLISAEFVLVEDWRTCLKYTYDISAFAAHNLDEVEIESASTISGDWNLATGEQLAHEEWDTVEEKGSLGSLPGSVELVASW